MIDILATGTPSVNALGNWMSAIPGLRFSDPFKALSESTLITDPRGRGLVVVRDNHVVLLYVEPAHRGEGLGHALMRQAHKLVRPRTLTLKCDRALVRYYERMGYRVIDDPGGSHVGMRGPFRTRRAFREYLAAARPWMLKKTCSGACHDRSRS